MKALELKVPPVVLVILIAGIMLLLSPLFPQVHFQPLPNWIIAIIAALGVIIPLIGVISFKRAATTPDPRDPTKTNSLVTTGIYRYTRNPMYLGFALLLLAWGLYLANMATLFGLPAYMFYMNQFQIKPEERALAEKFGRDYTQYHQKTKRWL
ncbi:isoprenylcysteine carboxylmethyltransferase family protein [Idiomarina sp. OT37-5b]|jgi:protein-S-isoprenylcysteine O-methyltransferase Ste14|uniref:methyltransferase family protein n=1 Tax=Idiomarina sp. OT37-5b TaxID=2100422 RepID=UPI000CF8F087|nr:isoprenylcysteine carboxylmethyltransferase family protein [Idiomarina sp. OT37-5b]AVJ57127.1 isoprenylcysteine carboxylmethyltransferase family protein [Idiomarina sp. OT37-5b]